MELYVNDELLVAREITNIFDSGYALIEWEGDVVFAMNHFNNILVRAKKLFIVLILNLSSIQVEYY